MNMKKVIGILALQALILAPAYGQFDTPKKPDVNAIKSKILLVETQEEVTRTLMDLRPTPDLQQRYKDGVAHFNQLIQAVVDKNYKFGKKIEYMSAPKVAALIRDGKAGKYAILHYTVQNSKIDPMDIGPVYGSEYTDSVRNYSKSKGYGIISIQLVNTDKKVEDIYSVALPVAYPSGADMVFAIQTIQYVFGKVMKVTDYQVKDFRAEMEKNNKQLKRRTLLIAKSQVSSKTTIEDLKEEYYHPIEIVDYKTIDDAVMNNDSNYAYVQVLPIKASPTMSGKINVVLRDLVIDAKDGKIMATMKPGRMNRENIADDISKKGVKAFLLE
jgi:hypothetical protein